MLDTAITTTDTDYMAKRQPKKLSDQLREAIRNAGCSRYEIARQTGIDQSVLSKFMSGERGVSLATADLLCEFLKVDLTKRRQNKRK